MNRSSGRPSEGEAHLEREAASPKALLTAMGLRWWRRARRHASTGDVPGFVTLLRYGVRRAGRRAAPLETAAFAVNRYVHRYHWDAAPAYQLQRFRLPPNVARVDPWRFAVDLERITTYCGFSFAEGGWHPFTALVEEYQRRPELRYEESVLCRFYARFTPGSVQDALFDAAPSLDPLDRLPAVHPVLQALWRLDHRSVQQLSAGGPHAPVLDDQSRYLGPKTDATGARHFTKVVGLYDSVRRHGYDPARFGGGHPKGYFLVRDGEYRFVIGHSQRRLAALRAAGVRSIVATFQEHTPPVVDAAQLHRWSTTAGGAYPQHVAERLFDRMFTSTGAEHADAWDLR